VFFDVVLENHLLRGYMRFYLLNYLFLTLYSFVSHAGSYTDSTNFDIELSTAADIEITFENGGVVIFENLIINDSIDTVSGYDIVANVSRSFSCYINYNGVSYNIGDDISAPLQTPDNVNTGVNLTLNFESCNNGVNNMTITGIVNQSLDYNTSYHIDTQYVAVSYVPGTITSYL
jgi:hypothetical protein